jgi:hypothetical protein
MLRRVSVTTNDVAISCLEAAEFGRAVTVVVRLRRLSTVTNEAVSEVRPWSI